MSRKVIVASAKSNSAIRIENFEGTTFADLKANQQFSAVYGDGEGVELVVKPGNTTLRGDDSILPTTDFNVYIITTKNKAGVAMNHSQAKEVGSEIVTAIKRASAIATQEQVNGLKSALRDAVNSFFGANANATSEATDIARSTTDPELQQAMQEARQMR